MTEEITANENILGTTVAGSTETTINVVAMSKSSKKSVVGRHVIIDLEMEDGMRRAVGTVLSIKTNNSEYELDGVRASLATDSVAVDALGGDYRDFSIRVQSVFRQPHGESEWRKEGAGLPTSPGTGVKVAFMKRKDLKEIVGEDIQYSFIGKMRGIKDIDPETGQEDYVSAPLTLPNFSTGRGATHSAIIGRSGSGKTALSAYLLSAQLRHEDQAMILIDPQGQWSGEQDFLISPQKLAEALGRPVHRLRIMENIKLEYDVDFLAELLEELNIWRKGILKMSSENSAIFSEELAGKLTRYKQPDGTRGLDGADLRDVLTYGLQSLRDDHSSIRKIYASENKQEELKNALDELLLDVAYDEDGNEVTLSEDQREAREARWQRMLDVTTPLLNLFQSTNMQGGTRYPLADTSSVRNDGFLSQVLQARTTDYTKLEEPAPVVIIDMSVNTEWLNAMKYAAETGTGGMSREAVRHARNVFDNPNLKRVMLDKIFSDIKEASETAYGTNAANLNTQIIFDEAWQYAPPVSDNDDSMRARLSRSLEGYARDTRKYGIGWTYILQAPSDLNRGIWKQLMYIYAGHGIVGGDRAMLGDRMDELSKQGQLGLYSQLPAPETGEYAFMLLGELSPVIASQTPTYINSFSNVHEFYGANQAWIQEIISRRGLLPISPEKLQVEKKGQHKANRKSPVALSAPQTVSVPTDTPKATTYTVGGTGAAPKASPVIRSKADVVSDSAGDKARKTFDNFDEVEPPPF